MTALPKTSFTSCRSLVLIAVAALFLISTSAQAQVLCTKQRPCDSVEFSFEDDDGNSIAGVTASPDELLEVLMQYTQPEVNATRGTRIRFVYGIGSADGVSDPVISDEVLMVPGEPSFIGGGEGPLTLPWDAFDDPLLGFDDPLLGFDDPLLGFDDPLLGLVVECDYESPIDARTDLEAIWGNGGTYVDEGGPDYGLVFFSMTAMPDANVNNRTVLHRSAIVPFSIEEASPAKRTDAVPEQMTLEAAYPNPFNPQTKIRYALPEATDVHLAVYNLMGREVAVLAEGMRPAGTHTATFDAAGLPSGLYLYRLEAGAHAQTRRMTLVK